MGTLACAILAVNNIRDRAQDELAGKRTLAVRLGDVTARRVYVSLLVIAHLAAIATLIPTALLTLLAVPMSYSISKSVLRGISGKDLIPTLGRTGKLQLVFAILFALGIAIQ
jgi:1,4-dihydroxy-2-naphthoate octaprenyltransferase